MEGKDQIYYTKSNRSRKEAVVLKQEKNKKDPMSGFMTY